MLRIREPEGRHWDVQASTTASGFVEAGTYVVQIDGPGVNVLVDDVPLERQPGHNAYLWRPGFYAGRVRAEILDDRGRALAECSLDVGPSPDKLGQGQFLHMVDEIMASRPYLLVGDGAAGPEFGSDGEPHLPEVAYARLRRYGPACLEALRDLCSSPLMRLHQHRRTVEPHQARRLDVLTVKELARSRLAGHVLGLEGGSSDYPTRISVPYVERTFDHAANRAIAVMVDRLISKTAGLVRHFSFPIGDTDDSLARKIPRRLHILGELHEALLRIRGSPALSAVTRPEISAAGLNAISAQPNYARAYQFAWKALKTGILGSNRSDPLPISPTWEVFERWCFLRIWQLLESIAPAGGWKAHVEDANPGRLRVFGQVGGTAFTLHLQPIFPAWDQPSKWGFKSLSRLREPDLVLTAESPRRRSFLVLDAKYRASRPNVLDAMQSAHIYSDSLMWEGVRPLGSYLLLPRHGAVNWLGVPQFRAEYGVGTFEVAPGSDASSLVELLSAFLAPPIT